MAKGGGVRGRGDFHSMTISFLNLGRRGPTQVKRGGLSDFLFLQKNRQRCDSFESTLTSHFSLFQGKRGSSGFSEEKTLRSGRGETKRSQSLF